MTKKHFISLAKHIRLDRAAWTDPALTSLAEWLQTHNPNFMRSRWLDYIDGVVGPNGGKLKDRART